jgi:hypothetical protein
MDRPARGGQGLQGIHEVDAMLAMKSTVKTRIGSSPLAPLREESRSSFIPNPATT